MKIDEDGKKVQKDGIVDRHISHDSNTSYNTTF